MKQLKLALFLLAFVLLPTSAALAQSGKIAGTVTDAETGETIPGANVVVLQDGEFTGIGAQADMDGYYAILNISPGTYDVRASFVGYSPVVNRGVRVNIDLTSTIDFALPVATGELDEVVVEADEPVIKQDVAAQTINLSDDQIEGLPISRLESLIGIQAGADGLSIRGGSVNELGVNLNGLSMRTARSGSPFVSMSFTAIEDVQLQTGGFSAEYGNLRSGNVNVEMVDPPRDYFTVEALIRYAPPRSQTFKGFSPNDPDAYWTRPWVDDPNLSNDVDPAYVGTEDGAWDKYTQRQYPEFRGWQEVAEELAEDGDPTNDLTVDQLMNEYLPWIRRKSLEVEVPQYDVDVTVGGPLTPGDMLGDLRFTASYRREQQPYMNPKRREATVINTIQPQLITNLSQGMKLSLLGLYSWTEQQEGGDDFMDRTNIWSLDNESFIDEKYFMLGAKLTHSLSPRTFYTMSLSRFGDQYLTRRPPERQEGTVKTIGSLQLDEAPFGWRADIIQAYGNLMQTSAAWWAAYSDSSSSVTYDFKLDLTNQFNRYVQFKTGLNYVRNNYEMRYGELNPVEVEPDFTFQRWEAEPQMGAAYAQTKLEFKGMIGTAGLRLDYFHGGGDWYDFPTFTRAFSPGNVPPNGTGDDLRQLADERDDFDVESADHIFSLSPRLGVSFPVTTVSKIYFNYGQYRQMQVASEMYEISRALNGAISRIGNPNMPLPVTTSYELGYERSFFDMVRFGVAGYYRDSRNQPRLVYYEDFTGDVGYEITQPLNYADARGVELTLDKFGGQWVQGFFNFTYLQTKSGNFGYGSVFQNLVQQREYLRTSTDYIPDTPVPTPSANFNITFLAPDNFGPQVAGVQPLSDWRLSLLGSWLRPAPFTWFGQGTPPAGFRNNVRWPDVYSFDMRLSKTFSALDTEVGFFVDVVNPFNIRRMNPGSFLGPRDYEYYMQSLHLPEEAFEDADRAPYLYVAGDDQPGDYRKIGTEFVPIEAVSSLESVSDPNTRALFYDTSSGAYYRWDGNGNWQAADGGFVDEVLENKQYIDMPNANWMWFLNPRYVLFGLSLSF